MQSDIHKNINNTSGPQTQSHSDEEGKAPKCRGCRGLVWITVSLGHICLLLLIVIILQQFMITAERDKIKSCKSTAEGFYQTMFCLESKATPLNNELKKNASKQGNLCTSDGFLISTEKKNWSDSRQFCRDHGADLLIIKSKEKQMKVSSFLRDKMDVSVWIGLSDIENEGHMKWVDNSSLNQG
ncbi:hypothetical protein QQF64_020454, partial [Cirrhinus molitorella]